jgi:hypothetical protein
LFVVWFGWFGLLFGLLFGLGGLVCCLVWVVWFVVWFGWFGLLFGLWFGLLFGLLFGLGGLLFYFNVLYLYALILRCKNTSIKLKLFNNLYLKI